MAPGYSPPSLTLPPPPACMCSHSDIKLTQIQTKSTEYCSEIVNIWFDKSDFEDVPRNPTSGLLVADMVLLLSRFKPSYILTNLSKGVMLEIEDKRQT